jgi:hypothetical protein
VLLPAVLAPLAVVLLAACGGSTGAAAGGATPSASQSGTGTGAGRNGAGPPGVNGLIAEVTRQGSKGTLQVQDTNAQTAVTYASTTRFSQTIRTKLAVGDCVTVTGTPVTGSTDAITASSVRVFTPTNGSCTFTAGGQGRPRGSGSPSFPADGAGPPSGVPGNGGNGGPGAGNGTGGRTQQNFAAALGKVTSVSGTTVVISGTLRSGGRPGMTPSPSATPTQPPAGPVTVTLPASVAVTKTVSATSAAAVVGKCAAATGKADSAGTVAATSIMISAPGPNGCSRGFGRFGGRGGAGGG